MISLLVWLVIGGLVGWLASVIIKTGGQQGMFLNIVTGVIGAMIGGALFAPFLGAGALSHNDFSMASLAVSLIGSLLLLAIVTAIGGRRRRHFY